MLELWSKLRSNKTSTLWLSTNKTVAQDTGLGTAYTIAHEMGHAFGLLHDGDGNHCRSYPGTFMAPMLRSSGSGQFQWSSCSRSRMESFLDSDQAWCLYQTQDESETPQNGHFVKTRSLTQMVTKRGKTELVNYSASEQCEMQFGRGTKVCPYKINGMCQQLHCQTGAHLCQSLLLPGRVRTNCNSLYDSCKFRHFLLRVYLLVSTFIRCRFDTQSLFHSL